MFRVALKRTAGFIAISGQKQRAPHTTELRFRARSKSKGKLLAGKAIWPPIRPRYRTRIFPARQSVLSINCRLLFYARMFYFARNLAGPARASEGPLEM